MCKYLKDCGFNVFEFGTYDNGNIDIESNHGIVISDVSRDKLEQLDKYMQELLLRVEDYIRNNCEEKQGD